MGEIQTVALVTSAVMALVLVATLRDVWKRAPFPGLTHGSLELRSRSMKWVWGVVLLLAFLTGGPEVRSRTVMNGVAVDYWNPATMGAAGHEQIEQIDRQSGWEVRLATLRYGVNEIRWRSGEQFRTERAAFHLPLWFPLALLTYLLVVVRRGERVPADGRVYQGHSLSKDG